MIEKPEVGKMPIACRHGVRWEVNCPDCMTFAIDKRNETIATQSAAIEALREERRWIPVGDWLPRYGVPVLLAIAGTVQNETYMLDGADECPDWFEPYGGGDGEHSLWWNTASHWMPLPTPPTDTGEGE